MFLYGNLYGFPHGIQCRFACRISCKFYIGDLHVISKFEIFDISLTIEVTKVTTHNIKKSSLFTYIFEEDVNQAIFFFFFY